MTLIKTSLLNAVAVAIKMLTLLGLNKILAIYVGPSGYAVIGQFQNAMTMVMTFAGGAVNTGVTKYTAEYHKTENEQHKVWQTALRISLVFTLILSILIGLFSQWLAETFLKDAAYSGIFLWFSVTLIFFVLNSLLLAIINGKKEITLYISVNIAGSLVGLLVTSILAYTYGLYGALLALVTNQSIVFVVTLWLCRHQVWFKLACLWGEVDHKTARNLGKYVSMALTSAIAVPMSHMLIRSHLVNNFGWEGAGYWDGVWRISSIYLMFITTTLGVYYLPRLSEIIERKELRKEIINGYKVILPIVSFLAFSIYMLRDFIVAVLFTSEFSEMSDLFAWQMTGDVVKIASWLMAYLMLGKGTAKLFIFTEIIFSITFYLFTILLTNYFSLKGVTIAYFVNYVIYFIVVSVSLFKMRIV